MYCFKLLLINHKSIKTVSVLLHFYLIMFKIISANVCINWLYYNIA